MNGATARTTPRTGRKVTAWLLTVLYGVAGVAHLAAPTGFVLIVPHVVPRPALVVWATGWCEIAGAAGLQIGPLRRASGTALALYAICVFPANVHHAIYGLPPGYPRLGPWYHVPRLLFQPVLVWAGLYAGGPWRHRRAR